MSGSVHSQQVGPSASEDLMSENRTDESTLKPHRSAAHVFVMLRLDLYMLDLCPIEKAITVTKVFRSELAARAETERLNALKGPNGSRYFYEVGRLYESDDGSEETVAGTRDDDQAPE